MPQSTTAPQARPERPSPGQPRVEMPVSPTSDAPPPPKRRMPREAPASAGDPMPAYLDDRTPAMEPWLWVLFASLVPAALALFVPHPVRPALFVATALLVLAGFVMLVMQETRKRRRVEAERATP